MNVEEAFSRLQSLYGISFNLKEGQFAVIKAILLKKNVFCILPTGFGKSATFVLPPLILDEVSVRLIYLTVLGLCGVVLCDT